MRTTIALDDDLVEKAKKLTSINENVTLVREALKSLIERESAQRLAVLGGHDLNAKTTPGRRSVRQ